MLNQIELFYCQDNLKWSWKNWGKLKIQAGDKGKIIILIKMKSIVFVFSIYATKKYLHTQARVVIPVMGKIRHFQYFGLLLNLQHSQVQILSDIIYLEWLILQEQRYYSSEGNHTR